MRTGHVDERQQFAKSNALHVERSAPIHLIEINVGGKWWMRPTVLRRRNDVDVIEKQQTVAVLFPRDARVDAGAPRRRFDDLGMNAVLFEEAGQKSRAR